MATIIVTTNNPDKFEKTLSSVGEVKKSTKGKVTILKVEGSKEAVDKAARNVGRRANKTGSSVGRSS
jgi:hypothetical protein